MQISRAPKLEWNLNTIIQLFTLVGMIVVSAVSGPRSDVIGPPLLH